MGKKYKCFLTIIFFLMGSSYAFAFTADDLIQDIIVKQGGERTIGPGTYGEIKIKEGGTLYLETGIYDGEGEIYVPAVYSVTNLTVHHGAKVLFKDPNPPKARNYLNINGRLVAHKDAYIGPEAYIGPNGAYIGPEEGDPPVSDFVIFVNDIIEKHKKRKFVIKHKDSKIIPEPIIPEIGIAAANKGGGSLAIVSLSQDNVFHYDFIDGDFAGYSNTVQLSECYEADEEMDGQFLCAQYYDENGDYVYVGPFLKLSYGGMGTFINDPVIGEAMLIAKFGSSTLPTDIDGAYNAFIFLALDLIPRPVGFNISGGGSILTVENPADEADYIFSMAQNEILSNVLQAELDGDDVIDLNLILDGNSMLLDYPGGGYFGAGIGGFGAGIRAVPVDLSTIPDGQKFYVLSGAGLAWGRFYPDTDRLDYEIHYSDEYYDISGTFVFGGKYCGEVALPNDGVGWGCDNKEEGAIAIIIDPDQGLLAIVGSSFWIGGW